MHPPPLVISDLLLLAHIVWDLTDTLSTPTSPTSSAGEAAQAEILDLLDRLRNIHLSLQYIVKQSRQTNPPEKPLQSIQDPLREFYEPCRKTLEKVQRLVGSTVQQVVTEGLDCDMYEQRKRRADAFEEADDTVWIMDGGDLVEHVRTSRSSLIVFEDQLNWIVETIRTMTEKRTTESSRNHKEQQKSVFENAALEVPATRARSGTEASVRSIASTISHMNDVATDSKASKGGSLEDEIRGLMSNDKTHEESSGAYSSIEIPPEPPLPVPPHFKMVQSSGESKLPNNRDGGRMLGSMRSTSPEAIDVQESDIRPGRGIQNNTSQQTHKSLDEPKSLNKDSFVEQKQLKRHGASPPPPPIRRNPIKRPSKQAYVRDESSEDEAIVLGPETPVEIPEAPKHTAQAAPELKIPKQGSPPMKQESSNVQRAKPKLDVTFEIETWMGGFYSFTDCHYAIINPDFLKDGRNRVPMFKCLCEKHASSAGYANTFKPVSAFSKNNHDEKIGQFFGTTNTLIVSSIGQLPTQLLAVNLLEKMLFDDSVTERNIVNELHLNFRDEASAKTFQDGIGHIFRVRAIRALHEGRLERSLWIDYKEVNEEKRDVVLVAHSCKTWRESAIGDNTSCEWVDKSANSSWRMLPGHSGLRELSVVHYMEIKPSECPKLFHDDEHWSLELKKCTEAGLSVVGPEAKSRVDSRGTVSHTLHHSLDKGCLTLRPSSTIICDMDTFGREVGNRRLVNNAEIQLKRVKNSEIRQILDQAIKHLKSISQTEPANNKNSVASGSISQDSQSSELRCMYSREHSLENIYSMGRPFCKSVFRDGKVEIVYDPIKQCMTVLASDVATGKTVLTQRVNPRATNPPIEFMTDHFNLSYTTVMKEGNEKENVISKDGELKLRYQFKKTQDLNEFKTAYEDTYSLCAVPSPHATFRHVPARPR